MLISKYLNKLATESNLDPHMIPDDGMDNDLYAEARVLIDVMDGTIKAEQQSGEVTLTYPDSSTIVIRCIDLKANTCLCKVPDVASHHAVIEIVGDVAAIVAAEEVVIILPKNLLEVS